MRVASVIMLPPLSQLAAQTLRNSATVLLYLVVNLSHKLDRQIAAMLGDTVPVLGPKKGRKHICIISVCPHPSLWYVHCQVFLWPEDGRLCQCRC